MRRIGLVLLVVLAAAALTAFVWARRYQPLGACCAFGPGQQNLGALVDPVTGSGGKPVFFPKHPDGRDFIAAFDLTNTGRFAVEITGLARGDPDYATANVRVPAVGLELPRERNGLVFGGRRDEPFHSFTLGRHQLRPLVVRWKPYCAPELRTQGGGGSLTSADAIELRYTYLGVFKRTQVVELPFSVTLQCGGKLPASSR
jgi:hypothetical protein